MTSIPPPTSWFVDGRGDGRLQAAVLGVAVWGPGLEGWAASKRVLAGETPYVARDSVPPPPCMLGATERRRAGPVVRLALAVAHEAAAMSGLPPGSLRPVFGSSNGDGVIVGGILDALARGTPGERVVSPTQFHASVHNAAAGYWTIAHGSREPATCLGAHDWTWAASLLKAMAEVADGEATGDEAPVLLVCYDHPLPVPLHALRPTGAAFGAGLVLGPWLGVPRRGVPRVGVQWRAGAGERAALAPALGQVRQMNAVAEALPLLAALARGGGSGHDLAYCDGHLRVTVELAGTVPGASCKSVPHFGTNRAGGEA